MKVIAGFLINRRRRFDWVHPRGYEEFLLCACGRECGGVVWGGFGCHPNQAATSRLIPTYGSIKYIEYQQNR
jgi:hypothetical protein